MSSARTANVRLGAHVINLQDSAFGRARASAFFTFRLLNKLTQQIALSKISHVTQCTMAIFPLIAKFCQNISTIKTNLPLKTAEFRWPPYRAYLPQWKREPPCYALCGHSLFYIYGFFKHLQLSQNEEFYFPVVVHSVAMTSSCFHLITIQEEEDKLWIGCWMLWCYVSSLKNCEVKCIYTGLYYTRRQE